MKKKLFIFLTFSIFTALAFQIDFQNFRRGACPFCEKEILDRQLFYLKGSARGVLTHKPVVPGHVLIIPERHLY